ncbi:MAG: hypothetical protein A2X80_07755 [Geobacteraceae bacterium GWB2_52_12]|nr:MAG: hypothetical protein A2X80_07755 [Geobacteraceae bacterium GWB2_52_12]
MFVYVKKLVSRCSGILPNLLISFILVFSYSHPGHAATNCTPGQASVIGIEFVATNCPWESSVYSYKGIDLICQSGTVVRDPNSSGDTNYAGLSPQSLQNMLVSQAQYFSMKVFRNTEGTRFLLLNRYFGNGGSIDGKSMTPYPAAPTVNSDVFNKVIYVDPAAKPPCCLKIKSFTSDSAAITPSTGEKATFNSSIFANYPVTWNLSIVDRLFSGSGTTATATWDGKNAAGSIVAAGSYSANLAAQTSEIACTDNASTGVTVTSPCNLIITAFSASPLTINPSAGETTSLSWNISDPSGLPTTWKVTIAGRTLTSPTWDGKESSGRIVSPGIYTATLTVTNTNGCTDTKPLTIKVIPPVNSCPLNVKTN